MDMAQCIRNCLDCADVCAATARLSVRRTAQHIDVLRAQPAACITARETCAAECESPDTPHCALCAKICLSLTHILPLRRSGLRSPPRAPSRPRTI